VRNNCYLKRLRCAHCFGADLAAKVFVSIVRLEVGAEAALRVEALAAQVAEPRVMLTVVRNLPLSCLTAATSSNSRCVD
jgi:hypothetical protein